MCLRILHSVGWLVPARMARNPPRRIGHESCSSRICVAVMPLYDMCLFFLLLSFPMLRPSPSILFFLKLAWSVLARSPRAVSRACTAAVYKVAPNKYGVCCFFFTAPMRTNRAAEVSRMTSVQTSFFFFFFVRRSSYRVVPAYLCFHI